VILFLDFYCTSFGFNTKDSTLLLSQLPFHIFRHEQKTTAFQCTAYRRVSVCSCNDQIPPMAEIPIFFILFFLDFHCTSFGFNTKDSTPLSQLPFRIFRHEQKTTAFQCTAHRRVQGCSCNGQIPPMAEILIFLHAPLPRLPLHVLRLQHHRLHAPVQSTSFDMNKKPPRSSVQHTGGFQAAPATTRSHR